MKGRKKLARAIYVNNYLIIKIFPEEKQFCTICAHRHGFRSPRALRVVSTYTVAGTRLGAPYALFSFNSHIYEPESHLTDEDTEV